MDQDALGYSAMGRELERSALVSVFREWRKGWERNLEMFGQLPDDVQESIRAGSDDFVTATNQVMASWVFIHPTAQQRHIDFMRELEDLAESVLSQGVGMVDGVTYDQLRDRVDELEGEVRLLRAALVAIRGVAQSAESPEQRRAPLVAQAGVVGDGVLDGDHVG